MKRLKTRIKDIIPQIVFLVVTFCVFIPAALFLGNINEFVVDFVSIIPILLIVSAIVMVVLTIIGIVIPHKRILDIYAAVVFAIAAGLYIQYNFLNGNIGELNGKTVDWSRYRIEAVISTLVWLVVLVGSIAAIVVKREVALKVIRIVSLFLAGVQILTLVFMIVTTKRTYNSSYAISKEGEFTLSKKDNVVVFVVDTLDSDWAEEMVLDRWSEELKDFTYYDNVVAGGAPTRLGVPLLLTGRQYDTIEPIEEYYKKAFAESTLIKDLVKENYNVKLYTGQAFVQGVDGTLVDNMKEEKEYIIKDYERFTSNLYEMVAFCASPQLMKPMFYIYGDNIRSTQTVRSKDIEEYKFDDVQFYEDFKSEGLDVDSKKTYVFYHLNGSHSPYVMNEKGEKDNYSSLEKQTEGTFKIITEYIDEMKKLGVYDNSTIIITADHGGEALYENPAILVKEKNVSQDKLIISSNPATFKNVYGTMAKVSLKDSSGYYVPLDEANETERYHVAPWTLSQDIYEDNTFLQDREFSVFKIKGKADSREYEIIDDSEKMKGINK